MDWSSYSTCCRAGHGSPVTGVGRLAPGAPLLIFLFLSHSGQLLQLLWRLLVGCPVPAGR